MDIFTDINLLEVVFYIINENKYIFYYTCLLMIILIAEIFFLIYFNILIGKRGRNIKKDKIEEDHFLSVLVNEYKNKLEIQHDDVNTEVFIDNYFNENNKIKLYLVSLIKQSDIVFLLLGLLGAFFTILNSVVALNLEGISEFSELYGRLEGLFFAIKPISFFLITGIITALIINILKKLFRTDSRINNVKIKLNNYLENNIKYKYSIELKKLKLLEELIQALNNGFIGLEDVLDDVIHETVSEIKDFLINTKKSKGKKETKNDAKKMSTEQIIKEMAAANEKKEI